MKMGRMPCLNCCKVLESEMISCFKLFNNLNNVHVIKFIFVPSFLSPFIPSFLPPCLNLSIPFVLSFFIFFLSFFIYFLLKKNGIKGE